MKERLVGAAVLMAAAVILIPEMLSGPSRDTEQQQTKTAAAGEGGGESAIKTYTIDLNQSPGAQPSLPTEQIDNRAPPPEETSMEMLAPAEQPSAPQTSPESEPLTPAEIPAQRTPAPPTVAETPKPEPRTETPPSRVAAQPLRAETPSKAESQPERTPEPPKTEPRAVASTPAAPKSPAPAAGKGWAVQLVTYSSEATAQRLANEWRAKGQNAFVMPVTAGGKTLYRVRIGPTKDRADAEAVLKTVKASMRDAAVVTHP